MAIRQDLPGSMCLSSPMTCRDLRVRLRAFSPDSIGSRRIAPMSPWRSVRRPTRRFCQVDLAARFIEARAKDNAAIACARSGGRMHPAVALWPVSIRNDLRHALVVEDMRKVETFLQSYRRAIVDWPTLPYDPFFNANESKRSRGGRNNFIPVRQSSCVRAPLLRNWLRGERGRKLGACSWPHRKWKMSR